MSNIGSYNKSNGDKYNLNEEWKLGGTKGKGDSEVGKKEEVDGRD